MSTVSDEDREMAITHNESATVSLQEKPGEGEEEPKRTKQSITCCFKWPFKKKTTMMMMVIAILVVLQIFVIVKWLSVWRKSAAGSSPTSQCFLYIISCPKSWVGYEGRCYYFSRTEGTWDFGQRQCSSYGASLASIDTPQEMDFIMRYKIPADHWFGLRRQGVGEPWKWRNGSLFNNWFKIRGKGFCAYLDEGASSARCDTERNWICTKSLHSFGMEKPLGPPTNISSFENCTVFANV